MTKYEFLDNGGRGGFGMVNSEGYSQLDCKYECHFKLICTQWVILLKIAYFRKEYKVSKH